MRRAAKVDRNQPEIVAALRKIGAQVQPLHMIGRGCPDLLVLFRGKLFLLEVKDGLAPPSERQLTKAQQEFRLVWPFDVVESVDDALAAIGAK